MISREQKDQYTTLGILSIGLTAIGLRFHLPGLIFVSSIILFVGLSSGYMLERITNIWLWIGEKMGAVSSRVIMALIFIFFLTPIAVVYRLFSKKKGEKPADSYFVERNHIYTAADLGKVF
jgi:hypothetical protein